MLITRPQALAERTAAAVAALGCKPYLCPLLAIVPLPAASSGGVYDGAVFTSATAFQVGAAFEIPVGLPLYVVGGQTEIAARKAGFANIRHVAPDVAGLAGWLRGQAFPYRQTLVHYRGAHQAQDLAGLLGEDHTVRDIVLYETVPQPLPPAARHLLLARSVQWIMLYSRRTSAVLAASLESMESVGWQAETRVLCLSSAVSEPLYEPVRASAWRDVIIAATPDEAAMLACLQRGE